MSPLLKIAIVGATSSIAEHCARLWLERQSYDLVLIGRDLSRLEHVAADLRVRSPKSHIRTRETDFRDPKAIQATVDAVVSDGAVDLVLIAHGDLPDQAACQQDIALVRDAIEINAISPALFAEAFAAAMAKAKRGTLILIGSVAGDRGRKSNYVYGAAKALIERYAQGLQHRFAASGIKIVLVKPGPTATPMTAHLSHMKLAPVAEVAATIVDGVARGKTVIYAPGQWRLIMAIIRNLPDAIFFKLNI